MMKTENPEQTLEKRFAVPKPFRGFYPWIKASHPDMDGHHWCKGFQRQTGHWAVRQPECNCWPRWAEEGQTKAWQRWLAECSYLQQKNKSRMIKPKWESSIWTWICGFYSPEEGVMEAMGVAMMLLGLRAANCCICTAATVATGDRYADWATNACCWTSWKTKKFENDSKNNWSSV